MIQLFLCEPTSGEGTGDNESCNKRKSLLDKLEKSLWSLLSSGGRSESRLWLCNALSGISSISPRRQRDLFLSLLRSKAIKRQLASQLVGLIFEKQPEKIGPILAKKSQTLENFFKGNPRRIMQWFSNFAGTRGDVEHRNGAKALAKFAFVNRDTCWEELEWKGKHGQSPAMVATKPHYFLDLDVQRTVENFLEYVPEFWSSREFSESLQDGNILSIDTRFFVNLFMDLMYMEELEDVWEVIEEFLMDHSFSFLCHHLLIILEEQELRIFIDLLPKYLKPRARSSELCSASEWFEIILFKYGSSRTFDQLLLLNAVTNQGRHLMRLMNEEGSEEEKEKIKNLVHQLCESSSHNSDLALLMDEGLKGKPLELVIRLGLQCWVIHSKLSEEYRTPDSWESLFNCNGIKFHKSNKYALLQVDDFSEEHVSDSDEKSSVSLKRKKHKKHRRKRRRNSDSAESYENELVDSNLSNNRLDVHSEGGYWLLSTDGYSTTWSSVDLPEHLSTYCFRSWLKWVFAKWKVVDA